MSIRKDYVQSLFDMCREFDISTSKEIIRGPKGKWYGFEIDMLKFYDEKSIIRVWSPHYITIYTLRPMFGGSNAIFKNIVDAIHYIKTRFSGKI